MLACCQSNHRLFNVWRAFIASPPLRPAKPSSLYSPYIGAVPYIGACPYVAVGFLVLVFVFKWFIELVFVGVNDENATWAIVCCKIAALYAVVVFA